MSSLFPYLIASVCFILALQGLSSPVHARRGNLIGAFGMLVAVVGTLIFTHILTFQWIAIGLMVGAAIGAAMSIWIPMTKMPERIALSHCFGGLVAALGLEVFLGFLTFTGSLMAFGKLQGLIAGAPVTWKGQNASNITMFFAALVILILVVMDPTRILLFYLMGLLG